MTLPLGFSVKLPITRLLLQRSHAIIFSTIAACASIKQNDIEGHIGLYEIVQADCEIADGAYNPCEYTCFFEILKGQFYGVKDTDLAYVFWSGSPGKSELLYESQRIKNHHTKKVIDGKIWLNKSKEVQEYLMFHNGTLNTYYVEYRDSNRVRKIRYVLEPVRRGNIPSYRMNYPEPVNRKLDSVK